MPTRPKTKQTRKGLAEIVNSTITVTNASAGVVVLAGVIDQELFITDLIVSVATACNVQILDTQNIVLIERIYLPANGHFEHSFLTPLPVKIGNGVKVKSSTTTSATTCFLSGYYEIQVSDLTSRSEVAN